MSTEIQAKYGDSERRQVEAVERYAKLHGLRLAPPMRDLGISAFKGRHRKKGALGPFLAAIQAGEIEPGTLVIEAIDRLSREEPMTIIGLLNDILKSGFVIHILSQNQTVDLDYANQQSGFVSNLAQRAEMAHFESVQKSIRIKEAYVTRRVEARAGKRLKGNYHPTWITRHYDGDEVTFTVDEAAAEPVKTIFELAQDARMGAHNIAKTLNERGIPAPPAPSLRKSAEGKPRRWYQSHVGRVLTDRRVLGEYQPMRIIEGRKVPEGDPIPDHFPAIISPELFLAVQKARSPKLGRKQGARNGDFANLFTNGLAVCGHCGERMLIRGDYRKGEKTSRHYLRCARQSTGFTCENHRTPRYQWFETKVLDALPAIPWGEILKRSSPVDRIEALERAVSQSEAEMGRLTRASARLLNLIESDDDPDPEALERRRVLRAELKTEKARHADLIVELNDARSNDKEAHLLDDLASLRLTLDTADKTERAVIRSKMHTVLARIVETARFHETYAEVDIRGGMRLTIPLDETGPVTSGWYMGGWNAFIAQKKKDGIPPMVPSEDGRTLIEKKPK